MYLIWFWSFLLAFDQYYISLKMLKNLDCLGMAITNKIDYVPSNFMMDLHYLLYSIMVISRLLSFFSLLHQQMSISATFVTCFQGFLMTIRKCNSFGNYSIVFCKPGSCFYMVSPFHIACNKGYMELVKLFLSLRSILMVVMLKTDSKCFNSFFEKTTIRCSNQKRSHGDC